MNMSRAAILDGMRRSIERQKDEQDVARRKALLAGLQARRAALKPPSVHNLTRPAPERLDGRTAHDLAQLRRHLLTEYTETALLGVPDDDLDIRVEATGPSPSAVNRDLTGRTP